MSDWGCKSPTESVGGNREPEETTRDESIRHIDRIHLCREAVWDKPRGEPWYRTQVNPCAGRLGLGECAWQHEARYPTAARLVVGAAIAGHCSSLPQEISTGPSPISDGRRYEGNDVLARPAEKSDHPIVAMKPGNAGRAKGVTG